MIPSTLPHYSESHGEVSFASDRQTGFAALVSCLSTWKAIDLDLCSQGDFVDLVSAARYHGVLPIVAERVFSSGLAERLSTGERDQLRRALQLSHVKAEWLTAEVIRVSHAFRKAALRIAPYKGPVMAAHLWGNAALRDCADLDFLIPTAEADAAREVLRGLEYEPVVQLPQHLRKALLRNAAEEQYRNINTNLLLEVQWAPAPGVLNVAIDMSEVWNDVRVGVSFGEDLLSLAPSDLFIMLAIHGWKHNWERLLWVADVAQLIETEKLEWARVLIRARQNGYLGIVLLGAELAANIFAVALPEEVRQELKEHPEIAICAREIQGRLEQNAGFTYSEWHQFMLKVRERRRDQFMQILNFVLTPGLAEYAICDLPAWASGGYRCLRLARVVGLSPRKR